MTRPRFLVVALVAGLIAVPALPVGAAVGTVTLGATPAKVGPGEATTLSGIIDPASGGQTVSILDASDLSPTGTSATTNPDGSFSVPYTPPDRSITLIADWGGAQSDPVEVGLKPEVTVNLGRTLLFGRSRVWGRVKPALAGERVVVTLLRAGNQVATRGAILDGDGRFETKVPIAKPGTYRAKARIEPDETLPASGVSRSRKPPLPRLRDGSKGLVVKLLEQRLRKLSYRLLGINTSFDFRTGDAVLAFHKVQRMKRVKTVSPATWRKLASPIRPKPRAKNPRFHIEIDQTRQVLYVVRRGRIVKIVHTSTGRHAGWTRDGVWRVHRKIAGYSPGRLYYPSYFDGNRAVHGWPQVPTYPASHGCARVPYWTAIWLHSIMGYGTVVKIYH